MFINSAQRFVRSTNRRAFGVWVGLIIASCLSGSVMADPLGAGSGAIYRLNPASYFENGCYPPCLCPIMHLDDVRGAMKLIHTGHDGVADSYRVADVNWFLQGTDGPQRVVGAGVYRIGSPDATGLLQHRLELDLSINGDPEAHFDSGWVPVSQSGGLNISVSMNGMYCLDTVFHIDASEVPAASIIRYALLDGSTFQRGCWDPCDCLLGPELPMVGTFGLVPLSNDATQGDFAVVEIDWHVLTNNVADSIPIKGAGKYRVEPDIQRQEMGVTLIVGGEARTHYQSGNTVAGVPFPLIDIVVSINALVCFDTALHIVAHPVSVDLCGGIAGIPCDEGAFCKLPVGACSCDHFGICQPIPGACPTIVDPVCGCDGVTYPNECEADRASANIRHRGPCAQLCDSNADCPNANQFCKRPIGACDEPTNAPGVCTDIPAACPEVYDPVCGCDGKTYDNECFADASGVSLLHHGPCQPIGVCCLDIDDGPIAYDTCLALDADSCEEMGGLFGGFNDGCTAVEACCFNDSNVPGASALCVDLHAFCCIASGGQPQGPGTTCQPVPQMCGGFAGLTCPDGYLCADDPNDNCDPNSGGADCPGLCVPGNDFCGGIAQIPCPGGFLCVDDPTDNCDPNAGGADCSGVCVPEPPCGVTFCGGLHGDTCGDNEFCKFPIGVCIDWADASGICTPIPDGCPDVWDPVCGCDGQTYGNECEADAAGVSVLHAGPCNVCRVSPDGSTCEPTDCSAIPEERCTPGVIHLDISTGALTVDECDCIDFNLCHLEFGDASPFAVGGCPNGGTCEIVAADTDNDGIDDTFRAECRRIGACCTDVGGSPLPVPICTDEVPAHQCPSGFFKGHDSTCAPQACCMPTSAGDPNSDGCIDVDPFCCVRFGGEPQGPDTSCDGSTGTAVPCKQICGGLLGIPCDDPDEFCKTRPGECCRDFFGVCTPFPPGCPDVWDPVCGCDGITYSNECDADAAGVSVDHFGACDVSCSTDSECPQPDQFCKFPTGSCGPLGIPNGVCRTKPAACPLIYDPVCGCDDQTYANECHADMAGISVAHEGTCEPPPCVATRRFANTDLSFCPGELLRVVIELDPPASATALALEDLPPAGWDVSQVSDGGFFDDTTGKVKWGPLFAPFPQAVWYELMPTDDSAVVQCFEGTISVDGDNQAICGDRCLDRCCPRMQADLPQPFCPGCPVQDCTQCNADTCANGRISLCELLGYACAWLRGCHDDLSGMTRAAYIWRNGECYCWDELGHNWYPNDCPAPNSGCCSDPPPPVPLIDQEFGADGSGARLAMPRVLLGGDRRGVLTTLAVAVTPPSGTSAYSVEVQVPRGWTVGEVRDGGVWDAAKRTVRWGPVFGDESRTLSFAAQGEVSRLSKRERGLRSKSASFRGTISFDGNNRPIEVE